MTATDAVEDVVEEIVDAAPGGRGGLGLAAAALLVGAGIGSGITYLLTKRQLETKYSQLADEEIADMREHYRAKGVALEATQGKKDLSELVREKGYVPTPPEPEVSTAPPMAVQPPKSVMVAEDDSEMAVNDVEGENGVRARNVFQEHRDRAAQPLPEWDEQMERKRRSPDRPYVIHKDSVHELEGYSDISLTYYAADDVLCNERDEVVDPADRDNLIGDANLDRFGHGSDDHDIVFIRNDHLEIVYEVVRSPNSFAEEVHGFRHESWDRGNLERMRRRERDER